MKVRVKGTGQVIEVPDNISSKLQPSATPQETSGDERIYRTLQMLGLQKAGSITGTRFLEQAEKFKPEKTDQESKKQEAFRDRVIKDLEDIYFSEGIAKGNNIQGWLDQILTNTGVSENSPYTRFNKYLKSTAVALAKASGDVGNIAWVEQLAQMKAFPGPRNTSERAQQLFGDVRSKFALPTRDYSKIKPVKKDINTLLKQFEGGQNGI